MTKPSILMTSDGSHTLYHAELDETYHSTHGAIQESQHVFIKEGLAAWYAKHQRPPVVLEIGFGTGLNALLTELWAQEQGIQLTYLSLEKYPLSSGEHAALNYSTLLQCSEKYQKLVEASWGEETKVDSLLLTKLKVDATHYTPPPIDICFFDAFAFSKQPKIWAIDVLRMYVEMLNPGGVFVTYAARGQLKRDLKTLGLLVDILAGPPGKRHMMRGWKEQV